MPKLTITADGYHMDEGFMGVRKGEVIITSLKTIRNQRSEICTGCELGYHDDPLMHLAVLGGDMKCGCACHA